MWSSTKCFVDYFKHLGKTHKDTYTKMTGRHMYAMQKLLIRSIEASFFLIVYRLFYK